MTKLTTERLSKLRDNLLQFQDAYSDPADKENYDIFVDALHVLNELKAFRNVANNPVAWLRKEDRNHASDTTHDFDVANEWRARGLHVIDLYAEPVLPKQPEHSRQHFESLCNQFWNWAELDEIDQDEEPRLEWNGSNYTHRVTAALWKMYQAASAQPVIPIGLVQAINRLLDNDGSRGCFDALEQHRAKTELELLLAAAQQNEPQNIPENIPAQPVSNPYKFLGERAKYRVIIEGFSNSRSVDFEACSQEEAEEIGRDIFHEECNYGVERLESIPAQESE